MRALLCTHHLKYWSGSEVVLVELAEELRARGAGVDLYTPFPTEGFIRSDLSHLDARVFTEPEAVRLSAYDLVYVQHQTLSRVIATEENAEAAFGPNRPFFLYNHLSTLEPFELPGPFVETDVADMIWTQCPETQRTFRERYHRRFDLAECVPNPAPADFFGPPQIAAPSARPQRVLSVSNHLPPELSEAFDLLRNEGIEVTRFGRPDANRRLTPADLAAHDMIVTIGKSVQYALLSGRPVFCYDHFGGPGWLSAENFGQAGDRNFSGRCKQVKMTPGQIAAEIRDGYAAAVTFARSLDDEALAPYRLRPHADRLLSAVSAHQAAQIPLPVEASGPCDRSAVVARWRHEADLYRLVDREYGNANAARNNNANLRRRIRRLEKEQVSQ